MWKYFMLFDDDNSGFNLLGGLILFGFSLAVIEAIWESFIGKIIIISIGIFFLVGFIFWIKEKSIAIAKKIKIIYGNIKRIYGNIKIKYEKIKTKRQSS